MNTPIISLIAAVSSNNAIGRDNKLLWKISEDMKRFRTLTTGHTVIMGRKTFKSIGKPLPNRTNIVVTRDLHFAADGCIIAHSLEEAITEAKKTEKKEIFIAGGGQIYSQAISIADKLYLTIVDGNFEADAFFPDYSAFKTVIKKETKTADGYTYTFIDLSR